MRRYGTRPNPGWLALSMYTRNYAGSLAVPLPVELFVYSLLYVKSGKLKLRNRNY